jgi:hypothetical protein
MASNALASAFGKARKGLLTWYDSLHPLKVDIVGDFAGKELFSIHGDSMLLYCISKASVHYGSASSLSPSSVPPPIASLVQDTDIRVFWVHVLTTTAPVDGFQLLHAIHAVETFLENLKRRGCKFHVVWFAAHEGLCVPDTDNSPEPYLLTRAILIKHLSHHDEVSGEGQMCFRFSSMESPEYEQYLRDYAIHFFMSLDACTWFEGKTSPKSLYYLDIAYRLGLRGYSVAFLDDLEFVSSKV